jgi:hypothetical protein
MWGTVALQNELYRVWQKHCLIFCEETLAYLSILAEVLQMLFHATAPSVMSVTVAFSTVIFVPEPGFTGCHRGRCTPLLGIVDSYSSGQEVSCCCGTGRFIIVFTKACILNQFICLTSQPISLGYVLILYFSISVHLPTAFFAWDFQAEILLAILVSSVRATCHVYIVPLVFLATRSSWLNFLKYLDDRNATNEVHFFLWTCVWVPSVCELDTMFAFNLKRQS